jgi:16S rRNA (guanine527-N7)-methyltransferase
VSAFPALIRARVDAYGLQVADDLIAQLGAYLGLLARWNRRINLTSFDLDTPTDAAIDRLIVEPLRAAAFVRDGDRLAVDVGSGGGSPAIPIALACPRLHMALVEVRARKAAFLREAVRTLALTGARVEAVAFGALAGDSSLAKQVDVVTMRAVRADREIWTTIDALLAPRGQVLWLGGDPEAIETTTFAPVAHEDAVLVIARR